MQLSFLKKTFRDYKWSIVLYSFILLAFISMETAFFPNVRDNAAQFQELMSAYPQGMMEAFNIDNASFTSYTGFIAIEYLSLIWIIAIAILAFSLGGSLIAGEIDKGTSEFSYTLPRKRWTLLLQRFAAAYGVLLTVVTVALAGLVGSAAMMNEPLMAKGIALTLLTETTFAFTLLAFATFISSFSRSKGRVSMITGGALMLSYLLHLLVNMSDKADSAYHFSMLKYYGLPEKILLGDIAPTNIFVLVALGAIFLGAGLYIAEKRDL